MTNQQAILDFITDHKEKHTWEPSKFDIHIATGISRSEIDRCFESLSKEGILTPLKKKRGQYELSTG